MASNLLIVESPAKAKTIQKYLGDDFEVLSSFGHVRDLDKGKKGVDVENDFQPTYVVSPAKTKVVKDLVAATKKVKEVWLATDEDREGEAISWHLCEVLGLDPITTKRIVFSEITKPAIQKAVQKPRTVDLDLVNAQQARRILDRLVGFELSGVLWRKVKGKLSAGRVQSVAVKLIVEKEREIQNFESAPFFNVNAEFIVKNASGDNTILKASLPGRFSSIEEASSFINKCKGADYSITDIRKKPLKRKPAAPFTTSTLQQEASRKLSFSVNRTMSIAQRLYEAGHITYMRTDSVNLSDSAVANIANEIETAYGKEYLEIRKYKSKNSSAQEAHEAIRPTYPQKKNVSNDYDQQRLYELIWKRTVASQMAPAELEKTTVDIGISTQSDQTLKAEGEVLVFDGFLSVYMESSDDDEVNEAKGILPPLNVGQELNLDHIASIERFTRPPARYTEASLVKKLEELGIGRPSTYAPTISKIMEKERGYVTKESREGVEREYRVITLKDDVINEETKTEMTGATSNRLYSTDMGKIVTDFLDQHFEEVMNYNFTADVENKLDEIANGKDDWQRMLKEFYNPFIETVEDTVENAERAKGRRDLGIDPESGHKVIVQITRYGPVVQIGDVDELKEDEKPRFANLRPGQSMELLTYEDAMDLFKLPRELGEYKGEMLTVASGRYGPYVKLGDVYANMGKAFDPLEITREEAIQLMDVKLKENEPVHFFNDLPVTQGSGRFGPFLKWNDMFINIPRKYDPDNLSKSDIEELIEAKIEKEANRYIQRWPDLKIDLEMGRWGPFIRYKKKKINLPKVDNKRMTREDVQDASLDQIKAWIELALPGEFAEKKKAKPKAKAKAKPKTKK